VLAEVPASGDVPFAMLHGVYWLAANAALCPADAAAGRRPALGTHPRCGGCLTLPRRLEGLPLMIRHRHQPPQQSKQSALLIELLKDPLPSSSGPACWGARSRSLAAICSRASRREFCAACLEVTGGNPL